MNRKQRRAALKQNPPAASVDPASHQFAEAEQLHRQNKLDEAARAYKRLLLLKPEHAQACNNLALVLLAQGKRGEASARFTQALTLMPQLFEQFHGVCETLAAVLPPLGEAMRRARAAWPVRLGAAELLGDAGLAALRDDPLLLCTLQSVPVREFGLELVLTAARAALLAASDAPSDGLLTFACALARQCFINEYVFITTPDEDAHVARLKLTLANALAGGEAMPPLQLAALATYMPLAALPGADALLERAFPAALDAVVTQQIREPKQEFALRPTIPRLTGIDDAVSLRVQRQYEENPYPRWVQAAGLIEPVALDQHLRNKFPTAAFTPLGKSDALDILVAGCGTGWQSTAVAQNYLGARVLGIDLSLSSLSYAKRMTPPSLAARIDYAQADILKLDGIGRSFDMIDVTGVLHHMADPFAGWRVLLTLLRRGGIMHLGFYSEFGRRDLVAARAFIAERGYTPADIRRCRQDLLASEHRSVARFADFFTTSECRDLLFHVQESRLTIPAIKQFIDGHGLKFIGFDFDEASAQNFRAMFSANGWSLADLDKWHEVETQYPNTFSTMYQLWVQKN
jgi:2-polyprenyl-3-methyl-5-hydroxy-6-metoxy-1,4-benzoquinol methylase